MNEYCFNFKMIGEVADILRLEQPEKKLLVDISPDMPGHEKKVYKKYPNRATVTVNDAKMVAQFLKTVSIGDVVQVEGTFSQGNYIPYRTTSIDTVFVLNQFSILEKLSTSGDVLFAKFSGGVQSIQ